MPFRTIEERYKEMTGNLSRNRATMDNHQETIDHAAAVKREHSAWVEQKAAEEAEAEARRPRDLNEFLRSRQEAEAAKLSALTPKLMTASKFDLTGLGTTSRWQQMFKESRGDAKSMISTWRRTQNSLDVTSNFGPAFKVRL